MVLVLKATGFVTLIESVDYDAEHNVQEFYKVDCRSVLFLQLLLSNFFLRFEAV